MNPKISIIVPVYKVEKYINRCIDSILAQTFKDFELILIDDGSPDNCGNICEEYAKEDTRIKVIHKINGGQATARNLGLDIAKGEFIGFVDSDDYIEPDMYEILYKICIENKCEVANCSSIIYYPEKKIVNGGHNLIVHNREEAMKAMLEGSLYDEVVWSKLIKKELLNNIRFPVGVMYEDTAFTYKVIHKANKVGCIGKAKYNYIKRCDSTMDRAIKNFSIDAVLIFEDMYKFINKNYENIDEIVLLKLADSAMVVMNLICTSKEFKKYKKEFLKLSSILNNKFDKIIKMKEYPINVKILLIANKINPLLYKGLINIIERKKL